jgi:hypothetical protein
VRPAIDAEEEDELSRARGTLPAARLAVRGGDLARLTRCSRRGAARPAIAYPQVLDGWTAS